MCCLLVACEMNDIGFSVAINVDCNNKILVGNFLFCFFWYQNINFCSGIKIVIKNCEISLELTQVAVGHLGQPHWGLAGMTILPTG